MCLPQRVHITGESLCNKSVICCSVTQLCLTLCDPMDFSTQGFPVLYHILEYCSSSCPSSPCCHPTISSSVVPFSSCPQSFPYQGLFKWVTSFEFQVSFLLSSSTFIKRFFSSSSLSAIRVVSSAYLRLLIFLLAVLIPACVSSSPAFHMMYSAYKLNKQGDNI